jgi:Na+-driven multidrug efflux pump
MAVCLVGISVPVAYILPFKFDSGVEGLVIGYSSGLDVGSIIYIKMILQYDWKTISKEIRRINRPKGGRINTQ